MHELGECGAVALPQWHVRHVGRSLHSPQTDGSRGVPVGRGRLGARRATPHRHVLHAAVAPAGRLGRAAAQVLEHFRPHLMEHLGIENRAEWDRQAQAALVGFDRVMPDLLGHDSWVRVLKPVPV